MAGAGDIRDIMGMADEGPRMPAPKKKKKHGGPQPRLSGMSKEVYQLMGDSVPPIPLVETPKYKSRPTYAAPRAFKPRKWEARAYVNRARTDNLVLRHWKHAELRTNGLVASQDDNDENQDPAITPSMLYEDELPLEKYNVKVSVASYTDEQYEKNFRSDSWSKEETDYLMELCRDFDLRWLLITDRYMPEQIPRPARSKLDDGDMLIDGIDEDIHYPDRSMEDLKARYYTIAAKMLETHRPANDMTESEFKLWEKMRDFDERTEKLRKSMAEKLFERTKDEAEEEKILLEELRRITQHEDEFLAQRRDLYARLEPPPARRHGEDQSMAAYQTSSGLSHLLQTLLAREKKFKRPSMMGGPDGHGSQSATPGLDEHGQPRKQKWEKGQHPNQYTRRDTMDTQNSENAPPPKKGSQSGPNVRILTPAEELKYGISRPQERLTGGVTFRNEKVSRLVLGKSQVQMQKYQHALAELGIPVRLVMPTEKVCKVYERLLGEIQLLLDARRMTEKVQTEIKVLEEQRRIRLGLPKDGEDQEAVADEGMDVDDSAVAESANNDTSMLDTSMITNAEEHADQNEDDEDADGEENDGQVASAVAEDSDVENDSKLDAAIADDEQDEEQDEDQDEEEDGSEQEEQTSLNGIDQEGEDEDEQEAQVDDESEEEADSPEQDSDEADADADADADAEVEAEDKADAEDMGDESGDEDEAEVEEDAEEQSDQEDNAEADAEAEEEEDEASEPEEEEVQAAPVAPRLHKRSASVISDTSRAGSNRSAMGRKKRK